MQRAVANYNKSIESYDDLSKIREQAEIRSDQVDKIITVILLPILAWFLIQSVAIVVLWMGIIFILIPSAIIRPLIRTLTSSLSIGVPHKEGQINKRMVFSCKSD